VCGEANANQREDVDENMFTPFGKCGDTRVRITRASGKLSLLSTLLSYQYLSAIVNLKIGTLKREHPKEISISPGVFLISP
jgi:hypothetical protein